jgi:hypothetical protein
MTTLLGFDRPAALYEFASNHGIHAGSMDKLVRFALEIQRRALASTATNEEKEAVNEVAR